MITVETRIIDFKNRAAQMDLVLAFQQQGDTDRYNINVVHEHRTKMSDFALLGLAHHFINRKWAKDISYVYIMKSHISLTFTNETN